MANIITYAAFEGGELNISGTEDSIIQSKITSFITKYEPDYLLKVLGYPLYKLLLADSYPNPATPRLQDLMNGKEYEDSNGYTRKFKGFKTTTANPIANYVYYWITRNDVSFSSVGGEVRTNTENAARASIMTKQARAWNEMVEFTEELWAFLDAESDTYTEFDICQTDYKMFRSINSLNL